jgi:hypothetical protein
VASARAVLHLDMIKALEGIWGERWQPALRPLPKITRDHLDDFMGTLQGPGEADPPWRVYRGVYAEPTSVYFRVPLAEWPENII